MLHRAPHALLMSGTPQLSRPEELYTQLHAVAPGRFGTYRGFTARHCGGEQGRFGWECRGATNIEELRDKMAPYVIRELKEVVLADLHLNHLRRNAERGTRFDKHAAEAYFMECALAQPSGED